MDSLTQIVLGAAVGEAVLGKKVGNKALFWGAVAGTIPDLDVVYIQLVNGGAIEEIVLHRGISHSIFFAVIMAPILGWAVNRLYRRTSDAGFKGWASLFFWSIFTHPLLDCLTTYGTQLFLPFSDYRVSTATVFVVDPFYTVPFLLTVIALLFIKRTNVWRRRVNYFGLALSSSYLIAGFLNKQLACNVFSKDLLSDPARPELVFVGTTPLNIILWYGVAETDSAFQIGYYSFLDESTDISWVSFPKNHHLMAGLENEYGVERLRWFSDQLFVVSEPSSDTLNFYTLKFGRSKFESTEPEGSFAFYARVIKGAGGELTYESVRNVDTDNIGEQFSLLKSRIAGNADAYRSTPKN